MNKWPPIAVMVLVYWAAGFYPFHWHLPFRVYENAVQPLAGGGWEFPAPGIVKTPAAPEWLSDAIEHSALHIVLEVRSAARDQSGPARILTLSRDPYFRNLTLAQEESDLVLRLRAPRTSLRSIPSYRIADVFAEWEWQRIEIMISPQEVQIQINEAPCITVELPAHALQSWDANCQLALGNELTFDRPWRGEIRKAEISVGERTVDYAFPTLLEVPKCCVVLRQDLRIHLVPFYGDKLNWNQLVDWLTNLIGFIPFGFVVARVFPCRRVIGGVLLASCGLSLSIEVGQLFLFRRFPASEDLLLNVIGGTLGAALASQGVVARSQRAVPDALPPSGTPSRRAP